MNDHLIEASIIQEEDSYKINESNLTYKKLEQLVLYNDLNKKYMIINKDNEKSLISEDKNKKNIIIENYNKNSSFSGNLVNYKSDNDSSSSDIKFQKIYNKNKN